MYVTTFYSYKGGVGRTMALANVATDLVRRGRRVLLVDFDLEAPGLDTFRQLKPRHPTPGIVEYVSDYLTTQESPNVSDYVYEVFLPERSSDQTLRNYGERATMEGIKDRNSPEESRSNGRGRLWIMPAGRRDASYTNILQAIDWPSLYEQHDGYLMFEDLKEQWKETFGPDYVLIDSRTGHTDVAGICTRQLPNAVVLLFFPNDQNLRGLEGIVKDIREEAQLPRNKNVVLHFVMSNVPDLDDEDHILRDRRVEFRRRLQFRQLLIIHHYNSLALLNQSIFCEERSRSRLAQEYRALARQITSQNPEDKEGALLFLRQYIDEGSRGVTSGTEDTLTQIAEKHAEDGDIQTQLAFLRMEDGEPDRAKNILEKAIKLTASSPGTLVRRAQCRRLLLGDRQGAASDAILALKFRGIEEIDALKAVRMLGELKAIDLLRELIPLSEDGTLSPRVRRVIALELSQSAADLPSSVAILKGIIEDSGTDDPLRLDVRHDLALQLIELGEFHEAMQIICPELGKLKDLVIQDLFNYAMAKWGNTGEPDQTLFSWILRLDSQGFATTSANYAQCMSIANWVLGNAQTANKFINHAESLIGDDDEEFSCWRYLTVDSKNFRQDLASMREMTAGGSARPLFLRQRRDVELFHRH